MFYLDLRERKFTRRTEKTHIKNFTILNPQLNLYGSKIKEVKERDLCSKRGEYERMKNVDMKPKTYI
jgi:hypothetical protein